MDVGVRVPPLALRHNATKRPQTPHVAGLRRSLASGRTWQPNAARGRLVRTVTIRGEQVGTNTGTYVCGRGFCEGMPQTP